MCRVFETLIIGIELKLLVRKHSDKSDDGNFDVI